MSQPRRANGQFASSGKGKKAPSAAPYRPSANPAYIEGMRMLRQSNAAGTHEDKRTRRVRTRGDALRAQLRDQDQ